MFKKRNPPIGSRPGTLVIPPDSPTPKIRAFAYSAEGVEEHDPAVLSDLGHDSNRINWIDVQGLGDEAVLWEVAEAYGIHHLALEDAVNAPQRAKVELYDHHLFIVARTPVRGEGGRLLLPQVAMFVGKGHVVTLQERRLGLFDPVRERIRGGAGQIRSQGADYLAYALLDTLIDGYYPVVEDLVAELDELESEVLDKPSPAILPEVYRIRRELVALRRVGRPQRTAVHDLAREDSPFMGDGARMYLRDTHDHIAQVVELVESSRDVTMAVMDMYLNTASNRTNEIMKVLTLMASIFIPLTFLAGVYGMNFEHMPELSFRWAYPTVLVSMVLIIVTMLFVFARRGWLGTRSRPSRESGRAADSPDRKA